MPLKGCGGLVEPLQLLHLVGLRQGRRLKFAVDPLLRGRVVGKRRRGDRNRCRDQRDRAGHRQKAGPGQGPSFFKCRMLVPPLQRQTIQARVDPGSALFRSAQTVRKIATAETSEITVASHRLDISTPSPIGSVAIGVGADESRSTADGSTAVSDQRDEQPVAARGRNAQDPDALGFRIGDRKPGHDRERQRPAARRRSRSAASRPSMRCFPSAAPTPCRARNRARCSCGRTRSPARRG